MCLKLIYVNMQPMTSQLVGWLVGWLPWRRPRRIPSPGLLPLEPDYHKTAPWHATASAEQFQALGSVGVRARVKQSSVLSFFLTGPKSMAVFFGSRVCCCIGYVCMYALVKMRYVLLMTQFIDRVYSLLSLLEHLHLKTRR